MDLGLHDRVYLLTGATGGLGLATAQALVDDGARVVISSRTQESVDRAVAELGDLAVGVAVDNADPTAPEQLIRAAHDEFGRLDGALISVGGPPAGPILDRTEDEWRSAFETVFLGAIRLAVTVAEELGEGGSIAFVLSTSAKTPIPELGISNGLRPGLAMAAKNLADELGTPRHPGQRPAARTGRHRSRAPDRLVGRRPRCGTGGQREHDPPASLRPP